MLYVSPRRKRLLSLLLRLLCWRPTAKFPEWRARHPDSVAAPSETRLFHAHHPDWLGFTPDIQRLLR